MNVCTKRLVQKNLLKKAESKIKITLNCCLVNVRGNMIKTSPYYESNKSNASYIASREPSENQYESMLPTRHAAYKPRHTTNNLSNSSLNYKNTPYIYIIKATNALN